MFSLSLNLRHRDVNGISSFLGLLPGYLIGWDYGKRTFVISWKVRLGCVIGFINKED